MTITKMCRVCGIEQPATTVHFAKGGGRYGLRNQCRPCAAETARQYRIRENDAIMARLHAKRLEMPEHFRAVNLAYRNSHKPKVQQQARTRRKNNGDRMRAADRLKYANDPAPKKAAVKRHYLKAPEGFAARGHAYRARKRNAEGRYTGAEWLEKIQQYGGRCHWCGKTVQGTPHADHLIPLARGGRNDIGNVVPSCAPCNHSKGPKLPHEFNGRLL